MYLIAAVLLKDGHTVEYEEMEDWNKVELWVNEQRVFECDIRKLDYGEWANEQRVFEYEIRKLDYGEIWYKYIKKIYDMIYF